MKYSQTKYTDVELSLGYNVTQDLICKILFQKVFPGTLYLQ